MSEPGQTLSSHVTEREYRIAMSSVPTSVVIAAAMVGQQPVGMVVGTFLSMSLDPPLVGFFGDHRSSTLKPLLDGPVLSFSLLRQEDLSVCDSFRRPLQERFNGLDWTVSALGAPRLERALTTIHATRGRTSRWATTPASSPKSRMWRSTRRPLDHWCSFGDA